MAKKKEEMAPKNLKITLVKSANGRLIKQQKNLQALGLKKINDTVVQKDNVAIRGMIFVVKHLVFVEEI